MAVESYSIQGSQEAESEEARDKNSALQVTFLATHSLQSGPVSKHTKLLRDILDLHNTRYLLKSRILLNMLLNYGILSVHSQSLPKK